jgi:hypothetical protein
MQQTDRTRESQRERESNLCSRAHAAGAAFCTQLSPCRGFFRAKESGRAEGVVWFGLSVVVAHAKVVVAAAAAAAVQHGGRSFCHPLSRWRARERERKKRTKTHPSHPPPAYVLYFG